MFAAITAFTSTLLPHRAWGEIAWWGYAAAFLITLVVLRRLLLTFAVFAAVTLVPLITQAVQRAGGRTDRAQEEVLVVEQMGRRLLHTGTPYLDRPDIAALPAEDRLLGYSPYQPGMSIFGIPRALFGNHWWTDARIWFAVATVVALLWTLRLLTDLVAPPGLVLVAQSVAVLPICTLTLTTGGDDLPVVSLSLLAMAFTARHRWAAAGIAIGLAGALKLFALPAALVLLVLAWRTTGSAGDSERRGAAVANLRNVAVFAAGAFGLPILVMLPALAVAPSAFVENVLRFPAGHGLVTSPAQSPLPGQLIASSADAGRTIALSLLLIAGIAIGVWLLRRPPQDTRSAVLVVTVGLTAAILLIPSTRFGYLLYPAAFAALWWALRPPSTAPPTAPGSPGGPAGRRSASSGAA
ncbi:glycosyltransferase 87 family protein [Dactylosporangium siamense]|uniref:glycosyltransferase 87 family protein n=1 Tax=Dactylosporangium siamense TaxID=685454 RepID=UPI001EF2ED25|nr:glycosyltransferase 87 family protein [Dactylosporangium siamense]